MIFTFILLIINDFILKLDLLQLIPKFSLLPINTIYLHEKNT